MPEGPMPRSAVLALLLAAPFGTSGPPDPPDPPAAPGPPALRPSTPGPLPGPSPRARDDGSVSADPVMFRGGPAHTGVYSTRGLDGYAGILWRTPVPGPVRSTAAVDGDAVYVGSAGGRLHALDRLTGEERWRYRAGAAVHGSPAVSGDVVYVTDLESTLHAVDARTGRGLWRVETGPAVPFPWGHESGDVYASSPTLAEVEGRPLLYFGAGDGSLYAVDPRDEEVAWTLETGGRIRSTPAVADGIVVVGGADGIVHAADALTGEPLWRHATRGADLDSGEFGFDRRTIQSSPAIAEGRVHIGARDGFLYTLDLGTGERLWDADHEVSWVNGSPAVADGRVFAGSSDGQFVHALDAATGRELWRRESRGIVWTSPIVVGGDVIFAEGRGRIRGLDPASGETRWTIHLPDGLWASPVVAEGVLYIGTHGDGMYALRGGDGRSFRRAVVWDSSLTPAAWYADHERLAGWLARRGYERLDASAAERWVDARLADGAPGALVFAIDHLPGPLLEGGGRSKLRRWLEAGGTVVWPGYPPSLWRRDPETGESGGLAAVSWRGPADLLGVDHDAGNFDEMGAWATDAGRRLGLPETWRSRWSVARAEGLEPLAVDERGHLASWRRSYGGPPGTGFVRLWGNRSGPADLAPFLVAAEWRSAAVEEAAAGATGAPGGSEDGPALRSVGRDELSLHLDRFVREAMERLEAVPGLAVSVVDRDDVLVERGWGLRDVENRLPVDPETGFYIASATKSYVGLLTALLDDDGVLDLDAPLTACIPDLHLNDTVDPAALTLRDLLRHTRGWENDPVATRTAYTDFMEPGELMEHLATRSTVEDDGHFAYDNIGYIVTDLCYRTALGRSWKELLEARVLTPAGMPATTPYMSEAAGTGNLARPHVWDGTRFRPIPPKTDGIMHAAGGMVTTVRDAARWIRLHLGEGEVDGTRVFPTRVVRETLTRQVDADLSFWRFSRDGYGLGWFDGGYRGDRLVHHFGGYPGAQAHISFIPDRGVGVAAFVNGGGAGGYLLPHIVAAYVYDLLAGRPDAEERARLAITEAAAEAAETAEARRREWARLDRLRADPPAPAHAPGRYVGTYSHPGAGVLDISPTPGGGLRVNWGAREGDLLPRGGDGFLADWEPGEPPDPVHFTVPEDGPAEAFVWGDVVFRRAGPS